MRNRLMTALAVGVLAAAVLVAPGMVASAETAPVNLALASNGGVASASGQEVAKWDAPKVNDGILSLLPNGEQSRWSSNYSDSAWIQIKLAQPSQIHHVTLRWEAACAAQFKMQVSADGVAWRDASGTLNGTCAGIDRVSLAESGVVQYVRMQGIKRTAISGTFYGMSLWEMELWTANEPPQVPPLGLVPLPASVSSLEGAGYSLTATSRIISAPELKAPAEALASRLRRATGFGVPVELTGTPAASDIQLALDPSVGSGKSEAYSLRASSSGVRIAAPSAHGAFNAVQTLRQLFPAGLESATPVSAAWKTPAVTIEDAPRFEHRGIMLDVARSFLTVDEVKDVIDTIASVKMNVLHLHVADDQGWRLEITNDGRVAGDSIDYTRLTSVSGATAMTEWGYGNEPGRTGFYTQDQFKELVRYAEERFVQIIPEIDLPGHTNAALAAIPQLNTAGSSYTGTAASPTAPVNGTGRVGYSYLDPDSEVTFTFIKHVLGQVAAMTPGDTIHVGGDESHDMVTRYGVQKFNQFVARTLDIVHAVGKSAAGWNEISRTSAIKTGDQVQYWAGATTDLPVAAQAGAKIIASRGASSYLDMKYNAKTPYGLTWACSGVCDVTQYYSWDPATFVSGLTEAQIAGPEAPLWSETVRGGAQAQFLVFPRAIAHAEIGWTPQNRREVNDFTARLGVLGARLVAADVNFYDTAQANWRIQAVGLDVDADAGAPASLSVGRLFAPGTKASADGSSLAVDSVNDADGLSTSELSAPYGVTIEWGDGLSSPARLTASGARTAFNASGAYAIIGDHVYAAAGSYQGTVVGSDGRTIATFTARVTAVATMLDFAATAETRCIGSKAYVTVRAKNNDAVPIDVTVQTSFGERTFSGVLPGANAVHSFATRQGAISQGEATIVASAIRDGHPVSETRTVSYSGRTCG